MFYHFLLVHWYSQVVNESGCNAFNMCRNFKFRCNFKFSVWLNFVVSYIYFFSLSCIYCISPLVIILCPIGHFLLVQIKSWHCNAYSSLQYPSTHNLILRQTSSALRTADYLFLKSAIKISSSSVIHTVRIH